MSRIEAGSGTHKTDKSPSTERLPAKWLWQRMCTLLTVQLSCAANYWDRDGIVYATQSQNIAIWEILNPASSSSRLSCGYLHCNIHHFIFGIFYPKGILAVNTCMPTKDLHFLCWGKLHSNFTSKACLKILFTVIKVMHCQIPVLTFSKGHSFVSTCTY